MGIIMIFIILPVDRNYEHNMEHIMVIDHKIRNFMAILCPTVLPGYIYVYQKNRKKIFELLVPHPTLHKRVLDISILAYSDIMFFHDIYCIKI